MDSQGSGVGVLDKAVGLLDCLLGGPRSLADLVDECGCSRATTHRIARALEQHGLLRRDDEGRFALGPRLAVLGRAAASGFPLADAARSALESLRRNTGESVQLYVVQGDRRVCIASLDSPHGLREIVAVGASLPLPLGSAGRLLSGARPGTGGFVASVEERAPGVASVSAPIRDATGAVVAAVSVSGPIARTTRQPGRRYGAAVVRAARRIEHAAGLSAS